MARPKRSTAGAKKAGNTKSTSVVKKPAAAVPAPVLAFKASKITRWAEKKKNEESNGIVETVQVEVEKKEKTDVKVVEVTEEVTKEHPKKTSTTKTDKAPITPRKTRTKRTIEDVQGDESIAKRTKTNDTNVDGPAAISSNKIAEKDTNDITTATPTKRKTSSSVAVTSPDTVAVPSPSSQLPSETSITATEPDEETRLPPSDLVLPKRISRLVTIHSSIISVLLMHYASHNHSQPAILSEYLKQFSRNAATNVELVDLQRIITLAQKTLRLTFIEDCGNAIELANGISGISRLGAEFKKQTEQWWYEKGVIGTSSEDELLDGMELAAILPRGSTAQPSDAAGVVTPPVTPVKSTKYGPMSKGQRRLQDLKSFTLTKQTLLSPSSVKKENVSLPSSPSKSPSVANRNMSLLERIKAKAQAAKSGPAPEPLEVTHRRQALQWLEPIIPILLQLTAPSSSNILGGASQKYKLSARATTSYPMATVIQNIRTSLQKPISNGEAERSLRILADEVASDFVRIVEWKGDSTGTPLVGVVFDRNGRHKIENWKYVEEEKKEAIV
ncbi:hypothetical protein ABW20_dc0108675 [Dactylellina cionopaga]|nr:hypothetical protein ABW20_dc0108675 [Dactylellina cionopaga]